MSSEGKYLPIAFNPGIFRDPTEYAAEGYWYSMDKVRFRKGLPESLGGWQKIQPNTFKGTVRQIVTWSTLVGEKYVGLATNSHVYIWYNGTFNNITPVDSAVITSNDILDTVSGATSVTVHYPSHNRLVGDYTRIWAQGVSAGGTVFFDDGLVDYKITSVPTADTFVVDSGVTATATSVSAGGNLWTQFSIHTGLQSNTFTGGWGRGTWGSDGWGEAGSGLVAQDLRLWSMDNWGEDLLLNYKGGPLYHWSAAWGLTNIAEVVTAAPSVIDYSFVSFPARHTVAVGCDAYGTGEYDPMMIRWSESEDFSAWGVSGAGTAGFYRIPSGSEIIGLKESKSETAIFTDESVWSMKYTGVSPYWFSFDKLGSNCAPVSPMCIQDIGGNMFWMGNSSFYTYNGAINPLVCTLQKDIFSYDGEFAIDLTQKEKTFCGINEQFNELIWFYQSINSTTGEIDRYVIYNYLENLWYYGSFDRTVWLDTGLKNNVLAAGTDGYLYYHELGLTANNAPLDSYIESAPFDIGDGDTVQFIDRIVPDFRLTGTVGITLTMKKYPGSDEEEVKGPYYVDSTSQKVDIRARGRQAKIRVGTSVGGSSWQLGKVRLRVRETGKQ